MRKIEKLGKYEEDGTRYVFDYPGGGKTTFNVRVCEKGEDPHYSPLFAIIKKQDEIIDFLNQEEPEGEWNPHKGEKGYYIERGGRYKWVQSKPDNNTEEWKEKLWVLIDRYGLSENHDEFLESIKKVNTFIEAEKLKSREEGIQDVLLSIYHTAHSELTTEEYEKRLMSLHDSLFNRFLSKLKE